MLFAVRAGRSYNTRRGGKGTRSRARPHNGLCRGLSARTRVDILIVNSAQEVAKQLQALLERQGHHVRTAPGVSESLPLLEAERPDLLIADCQQLETNGASLFRLLGRWSQPPLLLLTTAPALDRSALLLPSDLERLQAVIVQAQHLLVQTDGETLRVGDLTIDLARKRVTFHDQQVMLPPIQFRLLAYLAQNMGRVVGARELLKAVWGYEGDETEARELVKVHVRQIRRKLGLEAQRADYVQSVRGFGYVVSPPGPSLS